MQFHTVTEDRIYAQTNSTGARVHIRRSDPVGRPLAEVEIQDQIVDAEDAHELAVFFLVLSLFLVNGGPFTNLQPSDNR